jgi:hypothetical protein
VKNLWNIADLIDLHYFFQIDEALRRKEGESALAKRDRIIYLAKIEPQLGKADDIPPRLLVWKWLAIRRLQFSQERNHEGQILPGTVWQELATLCRWLFFLAGLSCRRWPGGLVSDLFGDRPPQCLQLSRGVRVPAAAVSRGADSFFCLPAGTADPHGIDGTLCPYRPAADQGPWMGCAGGCSENDRPAAA